MNINRSTKRLFVLLEVCSSWNKNTLPNQIIGPTLNLDDFGSQISGGIQDGEPLH